MTFADDLVAAFRPWITSDLETYLRVLGSMFQEVEWYALDSDDGEGWTVIMDPDRTLDKDLRWLGQVVGERVSDGASGPLAREWVKDEANWNRGTVYSIVRAAQRHLTGDRLVTYYESTLTRSAVGANVDAFTLVTYKGQTPYPERTLKDILDVLPADIILNYEVLSGQIWDQVKTGSANWNAVKAGYTNWDAVRSKSTVLTGPSFSRPEPT